MSDDALLHFAKIGFPEEKAKETSGNKKLSENIIHLISHLKVDKIDWSMGSLLYDLATVYTKMPEITNYAQLFVEYVEKGYWKTKDQVFAGVEYIKAVKDGKFDQKEMDRASGVGVELSETQIVECVEGMMNLELESLKNNRYRAVPPFYKKAKDHELLKWADGKQVKNSIDKYALKILGPKDDRDVPQKKKKEKKKTASDGKVSQSRVDFSIDYRTDPFYRQGELSRLHKPGGNPQINDKLMKQHLEVTKGKYVTRFPPEPNGFLHIGHAKAININFGFAKAHDGVCYLRYDDTNPEAEEEQFFNTIKESVEWLGYKPWKITYSSDYFQELYELAIKLIKKDLAYVCHCSGEEIHESRGGDTKGPRYNCKHHGRPLEESLQEFQKMKDGKYKEGEAILRMKMDIQNPNPQFWDLVAYRVLHTEHFRTGNQWCIYPTYDFTHCLCDSFENITHSLCTTEFVASRESYYWLCDALEVYKPVQWEYARLNLTGTILSKRKLTQLVERKHVDGWDDPRLYTLIALKRRGFTPEAINKFVRDCGVSTATTSIDIRRLEFFVRQHLDQSCPRIMSVTDPIAILIKNLPESHYEEFEAPFMPPSKVNTNKVQNRKLPFSNVVFIDASDFKENNDPNFYRLSLHGVVGLLHVPYPILCCGIGNFDGQKALECVYLDPETMELLSENPQSVHSSLPPTFKVPKTKAYVQWVALSKPTPENPKAITSPQLCNFNLYSPLFHHENPMDKNFVPNGWLSDVNPDSLVVRAGFMESSAVFTKDGEAFGKYDDENMQIHLGIESKVQMTRVGYFCLDKNTKITVKPSEISVPKMDGANFTSKQANIDLPCGWVWNRTVSLKEDSKKDSQ